MTKDPKDPQLLELASQIAFHRGDYQESLKLMKSAMEVGGEDDTRRASPYLLRRRSTSWPLTNDTKLPISSSFSMRSRMAS